MKRLKRPLKQDVPTSLAYVVNYKRIGLFWTCLALDFNHSTSTKIKEHRIGTMYIRSGLVVSRIELDPVVARKMEQVTSSAEESENSDFLVGEIQKIHYHGEFSEGRFSLFGRGVKN
jgi:hypothetical protein